MPSMDDGTALTTKVVLAAARLDLSRAEDPETRLRPGDHPADATNHARLRECQKFRVRATASSDIIYTWAPP